MIGRAQAALLIRGIGDWLAAERAAGRPVPAVKLEYGDGLTREDAAALRNWGMGSPAIRKAYEDRGHPDHARARALGELTRYFASDHPQLADGKPAPWTEPLSPEMAAFATGQARRVDPAKLAPGEARAMIDHIGGDPATMRAYLDKGAAGHTAIVAEMTALHRTAAGTGTAREKVFSEDGGLSPRAAELTEQLRATPQHGIERQRISDALHAELAHGSSPWAEGQRAGAGATAAPPGPSPRDRIAARLADKDFSARYLDRRHPEHAAAVSEMRALHEAEAGGVGLQPTGLTRGDGAPAAGPGSSAAG